MSHMERVSGTRTESRAGGARVHLPCWSAMTQTWDGRGGWAGVLGTLTQGRSLDQDTARAAMGEILEGNATPSQIAGFIAALRMKGETTEELTGLVGAMLDRAVPVTLADPEGVIDIVGTGG